MFHFHTNHKSLVSTALLGFLILSIFIAIIPAYQMQKVEPLPSQEPLTALEEKGLMLYVSEGCVACHTQQVRNIEMDKMWGKRPSLASDYFYSKQRLDTWRQSPSLLGSERTGPDLTSIGTRQPSEDWHLLHLYNPRTVVNTSIMPGYSWLFEEKKEDEIETEDKVLSLGTKFFNKPGKKVIATDEAMALVAYLQSLKQAEIVPSESPEFIPSTRKVEKIVSNNLESENSNLPDGETLYMNTCAACHQQNGMGITGAFPPLAGSPVVNDEDPELMIRIILQGYDARSEYGQMPGFAFQLSDEEIAAIVIHERISWGNEASKVTPEAVAKIRKMVLAEASK